MTTLKDIKTDVAKNTADISKISDEFDARIDAVEIKKDKFKTPCVYVAMTLQDDKKKYSEDSQTFEQKYTPTQANQLLHDLELLGYSEDMDLEELIGVIMRFRKSDKVKGNARWYPVRII